MTPKLFSRPSPSPPSPHKERPHNFQPPDKFFFFLFFLRGKKKKKGGGKYLTKCVLHFTSPLQVTRFLSFILRATLFVFLFFFTNRYRSPSQLIPCSDPEAQMLVLFRLSFSLLFEYQKKSYRSCLQRAKQSTQGKCWAPHACRR